MVSEGCLRNGYIKCNAQCQSIDKKVLYVFWILGLKGKEEREMERFKQMVMIQGPTNKIYSYNSQTATPI